MKSFEYKNKFTIKWYGYWQNENILLFFVKFAVQLINCTLTRAIIYLRANKEFLPCLHLSPLRKK
ncbi:hypothetical protein COR50_03550 [Chitinophaga caeni]|uniref:Uncharacterized protein n=1 Tax=Chitinophaga caeni TaxID=2029983 RepID=A0A291QR13_9BACT|nr:hypothetical protein COR50_03550 [Chitinophaga caeni]